MKEKKTNAARHLDGLRIKYRLQAYPVDEEHLDAVHVAREVGMPVEQVFKTLVVRGDKTGILFAVVPGNGVLDLKLLAKVSGNKRAELVHLKEVLPLTGYLRAAVPLWELRKTILCFCIRRRCNGRRLQLAPGSAACS